MIQRELKHEDTKSTLLTYIYKINIVPLDDFASIMSLMPANTIIDTFDIFYAFMCIFSIVCKT